MGSQAKKKQRKVWLTDSDWREYLGHAQSHGLAAGELVEQHLDIIRAMSGKPLGEAADDGALRVDVDRYVKERASEYAKGLGLSVEGLVVEVLEHAANRVSSHQDARAQKA